MVTYDMFTKVTAVAVSYVTLFAAENLLTGVYPKVPLQATGFGEPRVAFWTVEISFARMGLHMTLQGALVFVGRTA